MNKSFTILTAGILLGACGTSTAPAPEPETQVVESFTPGTPVPPKAGMQVEEVSSALEPASEYTKYEGTLPAADAAGIKTTLILFENGRFALDETYIGRDTSFTQVGTYTRQGDIITLQAEEDTPRYYQLGSDTATLLDQDKKPVQGELAPYYTLKQVNE